MRLLRIERLVF